MDKRIARAERNLGFDTGQEIVTVKTHAWQEEWEYPQEGEAGPPVSCTRVHCMQ